jgi:hypothetical protein
MQWLKRILLRLLRLLFAGRSGWSRFWSRILSRGLVRRLRNRLTDRLLEFLLRGMDVAFHLLPGYRRNIEGYTATLVFRVARGDTAATVRFADGEMRCERDADPHPDVTVLFQDDEAVRRFLFSERQDILDSLLRNEVKLQGNYNHVYRFGFLARDLEHRLLGA